MVILNYFGYFWLFHLRLLLVILSYFILRYFRLCEGIIGYFWLLKVISLDVIIDNFKLL
jgi:hypothetical protein